MSIRDLFFIFSNHDYERKLRKKLASLELNIEEMKQSLKALQEQKTPPPEPSCQPAAKDREPPIIIEKINIEKIIFDKYELNNHFGQLGIKELKGKLNIGATYGSELSPKNIDYDDAFIKRKKEERKGSPPSHIPKVKINSKSEEEMKKD